MQKEFQLAVDIEKKILTPSFEVNTLDLKTIKLKITITKGMTLVDLTDITVRMSIRKPDGNVIFQDCQATNAKGGQVEIILENQAYIMPGSYSAEIMCFKGSDKVAVTGSFSYRSIRGIMDDKAVESKSEFTAITGMIGNVESLVNDLKENGTGIDAQARQEVEQVSAHLADTMTNAQTQAHIQTALNTKQVLTINIGRVVPITANLTIPENIRLVFRNGGKLSVKSGVTLTINGHIEAGYYQIFEFEDDSSNITTTKYRGDVSLDWFGADPNATIDYTTHALSGRDSSFAFKKCMSFVQDSRKITLKYTPNAGYYVIGNNPCGFQKSINSSCKIVLQGNGSRIYWKPFLNTDSCFGKLGLLYYSDIRNFDVFTIGEPGDRKGIVFNTKLGFTNIHFFSCNNFDSIRVNSGDFPFGCDKVFNFEPDGTHSHDDLSEFKNISAVNYRMFVNIANNESVKNTFINCSTTAYTDNAITFNVVAPSFSGHLSIVDHHFTVFNTGEKILFTSEQPDSFPINIERPRMEVKGALGFAFCDINSMDVYVNGLSFTLGGGAYVYDNDYFIIGQHARLTLDRCNGLYGNIKLKERSRNTNLSDAVYARYSTFLIKIHSGAPLTAIGFPVIRYDGFSSRSEAINAGKIYKRLKTEDMNSTNDPYNLPVIYSSTGKKEYTESTITKFNGGKSVISGSFSIPSDTVIESLFLNIASFDTNQIDTLKIFVYKATGSLIRTYTVNLSANTKVSQELIPNGKILTLPFFSSVIIRWEKSGVVVSDESLFPQSELQLRYRTTMTSHEANNGNGGEVSVL